MKKAKTPLRKTTKSAKRIDSEAPTLDTVPNVVAITCAFDSASKGGQNWLAVRVSNGHESTITGFTAEQVQAIMYMWKSGWEMHYDQDAGSVGFAFRGHD